MFDYSLDMAFAFFEYQYICAVAGHYSFGKNHLAIFGFSNSFSLIGNAKKLHIGEDHIFLLSSHQFALSREDTDSGAIGEGLSSKDNVIAQKGAQKLEVIRLFGFMNIQVFPQVSSQCFCNFPMGIIGVFAQAADDLFDGEHVLLI